MHLTKLAASLLLLASSGVLTSPVPNHNKAHRVTTPKITTPKITTPKVTTPKPTTPKVTTPKVTTPKATTPKVASPISPPAKPLDGCNLPGIRRRGCDSSPSPEPVGGGTIEKGKTTAATIDRGQGKVALPAMGTKDAPVHSKNVLDAARNAESNTEEKPINSPAAAAKQRAKTTSKTATEKGKHRDEEPPAFLEQDDIGKSTVMTAPEDESHLQSKTVKKAKKPAVGPEGSNKGQLALNTEEEGIVTGSRLHQIATGQSASGQSQSGQSGQSGEPRYNLRKNDA
ncbi:hypothetical protein MCOR27_009050 [Pyricularia oryzae]|uniref:Uncharacterized protein n=1 Tax=Pyricularia grisea TaxID=148305 RepID=A0ABQ8NRD6_PYRGI|nr:hypothetical protein MCOR01_011490 [Pyricularia oryzae]KAI6300460.1 hypothetical protein MCOR33_003865 [Pyricularia grisea]KAI6262658.1 hypothetical protein MCOR19_001166 [Pyricularia oryzae]KAI6270955.1 hypothetical protein MCOR27_009050 [Pyricularia oryzae]KAI6277199.1 hypothetical protein MCOR26_005272 [Pyricularia oryzae]